MGIQLGPFGNCWKCGGELTFETGLEPFCPDGCAPRCTKCGTEEVLAPGIDYYCPNQDCKLNLKALFNPRKMMFPEPETQESVWKWAYETFPDYRNLKARAMALIEEATELGITAGLSENEIQSAVDLPITKAALSPDQVMESDRGELADVLSCVYAYAGQAGFDAHEALNDKMRKNRSRPTEFYANKTAKKKELGLNLPSTQRTIVDAFAKTLNSDDLRDANESGED